MDMGAMMSTWMMVLTKPSKASFDAAKGKVNTTMTLLGLVVAGIIVGLLGALTTGDVGKMVTGMIGGVIGAVIGFYLFNLLVWVIAKILGGSGGFMDQANLLGTFFIPLLVVNAILGLIPVVGAILTLVVGIYELFLTGLALQSCHGLTPGKAWLVVAILVVLYIIFVVVLAATIAAVLVGLGMAGT